MNINLTASAIHNEKVVTTATKTTKENYIVVNRDASFTILHSYQKATNGKAKNRTGRNNTCYRPSASLNN